MPPDGYEDRAHGGRQSGIADFRYNASRTPANDGPAAADAGSQDDDEPLGNGAPGVGATDAPRGAYAALDLGTNNCRLLIARPSGEGFSVIDAFSRVVRLGEGLARSGRLSDAAMDRTIGALGVCSDKLQRRSVRLARSVATEACRRAANGPAFIERVRAETGIALDIISAQEEARLAVLGCHVLLDEGHGPAVIFDIGGGSTELVLISRGETVPRILDWQSVPWGVVSLTDTVGRQEGSAAERASRYGRMKDIVARSFAPFARRISGRRGHANMRLLGTSGTVTTLASMYLDLARYDRNRHRRADRAGRRNARHHGAAGEHGFRGTRPPARDRTRPCRTGGGGLRDPGGDPGPVADRAVVDRRPGHTRGHIAQPDRRRHHALRQRSRFGVTRSGRDPGRRVRTARGRTASSTRWLERQLNDPYVRQAKADGYRSRAAYKLIELDQRFGFLAGKRRIVDLGMAPGGWSQVARARVPSATIVGIDLLPVEALDGVRVLEADFMDDAAPALLREALGGPPDLVLSDMAANTVGHKQTDHLRTMGLVEAAAWFAVEELAPDGAFVAKVLAGGTDAELLALLKRHFAQVKHAKPPASRKGSSEWYVVAQRVQELSSRTMPSPCSLRERSLSPGGEGVCSAGLKSDL